MAIRFSSRKSVRRISYCMRCLAIICILLVGPLIYFAYESIATYCQLHLRAPPKGTILERSATLAFYYYQAQTTHHPLYYALQSKDPAYPVMSNRTKIFAFDALTSLLASPFGNSITVIQTLWHTAYYSEKDGGYKIIDTPTSSANSFLLGPPGINDTMIIKFDNNMTAVPPDQRNLLKWCEDFAKNYDDGLGFSSSFDVHVTGVAAMSKDLEDEVITDMLIVLGVEIVGAVLCSSLFLFLAQRASWVQSETEYQSYAQEANIVAATSSSSGSVSKDLSRSFTRQPSTALLIEIKKKLCLYTVCFLPSYQAGVFIFLQMALAVGWVFGLTLPTLTPFIEVSSFAPMLMVLLIPPVTALYATLYYSSVIQRLQALLVFHVRRGSGGGEGAESPMDGPWLPSTIEEEGLLLTAHTSEDENGGSSRLVIDSEIEGGKEGDEGEQGPEDDPSDPQQVSEGGAKSGGGVLTPPNPVVNKDQRNSTMFTLQQSESQIGYGTPGGSHAGHPQQNYSKPAPQQHPGITTPSSEETETESVEHRCLKHPVVVLISRAQYPHHQRALRRSSHTSTSSASNRSCCSCCCEPSFCSSEFFYAYERTIRRCLFSCLKERLRSMLITFLFGFVAFGVIGLLGQQILDTAGVTACLALFWLYLCLIVMCPLMVYAFFPFFVPTKNFRLIGEVAARKANLNAGGNWRPVSQTKKTQQPKEQAGANTSAALEGNTNEQRLLLPGRNDATSHQAEGSSPTSNSLFLLRFTWVTKLATALDTFFKNFEMSLIRLGFKMGRVLCWCCGDGSHSTNGPEDEAETTEHHTSTAVVGVEHPPATVTDAKETPGRSGGPNYHEATPSHGYHAAAVNGTPSHIAANPSAGRASPSSKSTSTWSRCSLFFLLLFFFLGMGAVSLYVLTQARGSVAYFREVPRHSEHVKYGQALLRAITPARSGPTYLVFEPYTVGGVRSTLFFDAVNDAMVVTANVTQTPMANLSSITSVFGVKLNLTEAEALYVLVPAYAYLWDIECVDHTNTLLQVSIYPAFDPYTELAVPFNEKMNSLVLHLQEKHKDQFRYVGWYGANAATWQIREIVMPLFWKYVGIAIPVCFVLHLIGMRLALSMNLLKHVREVPRKVMEEAAAAAGSGPHALHPRSRDSSNQSLTHPNIASKFSGESLLLEWQKTRSKLRRVIAWAMLSSAFMVIVLAMLTTASAIAGTVLIYQFWVNAFRKFQPFEDSLQDIIAVTWMIYPFVAAVSFVLTSLLFTVALDDALEHRIFSASLRYSRLLRRMLLGTTTTTSNFYSRGMMNLSPRVGGDSFASLSSTLSGSSPLSSPTGASGGNAGGQFSPHHYTARVHLRCSVATSLWTMTFGSIPLLAADTQMVNELGLALLFTCAIATFVLWILLPVLRGMCHMTKRTH